MPIRAACCSNEVEQAHHVEQLQPPADSWSRSIATACSIRRLFGQPDYLVQVAVADARAYEAFLIGKLIGLPALNRTVSHQTMKRLKG